jgi:hypothetical protein
MAAYVPGEIWIGGKIAAALVPDLCAVLGQQGVALKWGDCNFKPRTAEELLEGVRPNKSGVRLLRLCNRRARWSQFATLERFLQEHRVAYTRFSAGQQDYDHEKVEFRPNTGRAKMVSDSQGELVIAASHVRAQESALAGAVESARSGPVETAIRLVQAAECRSARASQAKCRPWSRLKSWPGSTIPNWPTPPSKHRSDGALLEEPVAPLQIGR